MPSSNHKRQTTQSETTRARAATKDVSRHLREQRVVELRLQGWSFRRIAEDVGYSEQGGAYRAWKRALANIPKPAADEAREHLRLQLEDVYEILHAQLRKGNVRAGEAIVKVHERYCRMLNLDLLPEATTQAPVIVELPAPLSAAIRGETTVYAN